MDRTNFKLWSYVFSLKSRKSTLESTAAVRLYNNNNGATYHLPLHLFKACSTVENFLKACSTMENFWKFIKNIEFPY